MKQGLWTGGLVLLGVFWWGTVVRAAPVGTAFTYQGQLKQGGMPVNGTASMLFSLWDAAANGVQIGGNITNASVPIVSGLFTVTLDFGSAAFTGNARWLQVAVNGQTLAPRQPITAAPYAVRALDAPHGHSLDAADGSPVDALFVNNSGFVGIGTTSPGAPLDAVGSSQTMLSLSSSHTGGTWLNLSNTNPGGKGWNLITTGPGNGEGTGHLLFRNGTDSSVVMLLTYDGKMSLKGELAMDQGNTNAGTVAGGLRFGYASGEAIASKRNAGGNQYGLDFYTASTPRLSIANNGNVGIGTTSPTAPLDIAVGDKRFQVRSDGGLVPGINLTGTGGNLGILRIRNAIEMWPDDGKTRPGKIALANTAGTAFTIALDGGTGNASFTTGNLLFGSATRQMLNLWTTEYGIGIQAFTEYFRSDGGFAWFNGGAHNDATNNPGAGGSVLMVLDFSGNLGIGTTSPAAKLDVNGRTRTKSLEIVGGADLAEPFEIRGDAAANPSRARQGAGPTAAAQEQAREETKVEPGTVVVIDPEHPGALMVSTKPHDPKVAGIVSGAKDLAPGMVLRSEDHVETDGKYLVAMTGRVWCKCDTSSGSIRPGDLLATSAKAGHAMRVDPGATVPRGAILGKAMTELADGTGLVLVLVNLQ